MAQEQKRGCGFRKIGGLYLVGEGMPVGCDRLAHNLDVCPTCNQGIKFTQGFAWVDGKALFNGKCSGSSPCHDRGCPLCIDTNQLERCGLMWVGAKFYTPQRFIEEASKMGISKRIGHIPRGLELGKTWVLLAHKQAGARVIDTKETLTGKKKVEVPAIFYAFRPQRVEKIITEKQSNNKKLMKELSEKGITPVVVDAKDEDHQGTVYDDLKKV